MIRTDMAALQLQKYLEKNTIKHPTALLHFERQLSDFEQGILFLCVHIVAKTERAEDGFYYLNKSLVRAVMKQEGNQNYSRISKAVEAVSDTKLKFNFLGQDRTFEHYRAPLIIGQADNTKRGVIAFEIHPRIEKLIKDPKVFARLNIYFISALADVKRGYSFYALFKDFIDRTKSAEVTLEYRELRHYLGISDDEYLVFKAFKQRVLKPLIDAVNARTDLHLTYEPVKTGRKLTHLKFTITAQAWQLQLFEAEHAERMVTELAKTFDGAVIGNQAAPVQIEATSKTRAALIDKCVKIGVTSATVKRALGEHGEQGVGEIITHTETCFKKMDAKGEKYSAKNYLAKMLNDGVGVKAPAEREKTEIARKNLAKREVERQAVTAAQAVEDDLKAKFDVHKKNYADELISQQSAAELAKLGETVANDLPSIADYRRRWKEIGMQPAKLDIRKATDKTIYGAYVVREALKMWGRADKLDFESFKKRALESA